VGDDVYRPMIRRDCEAIAAHYNSNLAAHDPLWCAGGREYDGNRVWIHSLVLKVRGRGKAICQVHERNHRVVSYFGGYARGDQVTFSVGIVDLSLPHPREIWRQDCTHLFATALADGAQVIRVHASSDDAWFVGWMEDEVAMTRVGVGNLWVADRAQIGRYIASRPKAPSLTPMTMSA
jgi:hypothetical protein